MSLNSFWQLLKQTGEAWLDNKAARLGAALAFYSILSLSPLLILLLAVASAIWGADAAQSDIIEQITGAIGPQAAAFIKNMLDAAATNKFGGLVAGFIAVVSLLFSASAVFGELQDAMNLIWKSPARVGKPLWVFVRERLFSVLMVIGCGFILIASVLISAALATASHFVTGHLPAAIILMSTLNFFISFAIVTFVFALIFKTVPDRAISWRAVLPGAALTASLFIVGKGLISLYLGYAGIGSSYGAAGSIVALLVWIYYSAQILFFGAEFAYVYACSSGLHQKAAE